MSFCEHCVVAFLHEGAPRGKLENIGSVETYVSLPEGEYPKDKAVIILTDVYGLGLVNIKLLADGFARNGFQVFTPELFDGDPVTTEMRSVPGFNLFTDWYPHHTAEMTRPKIDALINALKERGIASIAITGYCYGARSTFDYAFEHLEGLKAIAISHPGLLKVPEDLDTMLKLGAVPLLINSCEIDPQFPVESQALADKTLGDGKYQPGYKRTYWPGCTHGFAVRGDLSKPEIKEGKEGAFKATVEWFKQYL